jgi:hypothetical protein
MIKEPFKNEAETFAIDQLTIENRLDKIQVYGSVELTRDKIGLERAKALKVLLDGVVAALVSEELPDRITVEQQTITITNPFL